MFQYEEKIGTTMITNVLEEQYRANEVRTILETICLHDNLSTGVLTIEPVGPHLSRLIWYVEKKTPCGDLQVPVVSIVIPTTSMMPAANKMASAQALAQTDFVGVPQGSG